MKTTISMGSPSKLAGIGPDVKCGFGWSPWTNPVCSQIPGSPSIQVSHYPWMRKLDTPEFISTLFKGNKECFLESPEMKGSLPNSRGSADEGSHKTFLEIQPHTHGAFLEPFPDCLKFFHPEIYVAYIFIELFQVQDWSPFVRTSLRFWYCKV